MWIPIIIPFTLFSKKTNILDWYMQIFEYGMNIHLILSWAIINKENKCLFHFILKAKEHI